MEWETRRTGAVGLRLATGRDTPSMKGKRRKSQQAKTFDKLKGGGQLGSTMLVSKRGGWWGGRGGCGEVTKKNEEWTKPCSGGSSSLGFWGVPQKKNSVVRKGGQRGGG